MTDLMKNVHDVAFGLGKSLTAKEIALAIGHLLGRIEALEDELGINPDVN